MEQSRPNIVVIFSDQQHWQALGERDPFFHTPNLDKFAKYAVNFSHAFCTTPQCSPSRSSLLTGRYPSKTGVLGNIGKAGGNHLAMPTIGKILQDNGYYTGYFGKWHLGNDPIGCDGWNEYQFISNDKIATRRALQFLDTLSTKNRKSLPFALVFSTVNPHHIYRYKSHRMWFNYKDIPLPPSWETPNYGDKPVVQLQFMEEDQGRTIHTQPIKEWKRYRDHYRKCVENYDKNVGKLIRKLKEMGNYENSLILITSDHGDMDTHNRQIFKGPFMYDFLLRIPLMIRLPSTYSDFNKGIAHAMTVNVDILPTLLDFAQVPSENRPENDGKSLYSLLTSKKFVREVHRTYIISQYYSKQKWLNPIRSIREKDWKYNLYLTGEEELYDLLNDPEEITNLAGVPKQEDRKQRLKQQLEEWMVENRDPFYSQHRTTRSGETIE